MNEQTNQRCNIDFNIAINVVSAATSFSFGLFEIIEYAAKLLSLFLLAKSSIYKV